MASQKLILDYSQLSDFRESAPLNTDPSAFDIWRIIEKKCRDCGASLDHSTEVSETDWGDPAAVAACNACGWWCQYAVGFNRDGFFEWERVPAALRRYDADDIQAPVDALRRELWNRSAALSDLNPTNMEKLVGSILSDFMDCDVVHTGRTGDGGIDLLLLDGNLPYVVQVKRRSRTQGESVSAIREFVGATLLAGYRRGIYVTAAPHYTSAAIGVARQARTRGLLEKLHLLDRKRFLRILHLVSTKTLSPWQAYYRDQNQGERERHITVRFHGQNYPERFGRLEAWDRSDATSQEEAEGSKTNPQKSEEI
jgi:restriction system protein